VSDVEVRHLDGVRADTSDARSPKLVGHAIRTAVRSQDLGGFVEIVSPEGLTRALERSQDLVALANHDEGRVLGRRTAKTLTIEQDAQGLRFTLTPPAHEAGLVDTIARGDAPFASFAFRSFKDHWDERTTPPTRTLLDFELRELSVGIAFPAYADTSVVALRSLERARQEAAMSTVPAAVAPVVEPDLVPPVAPIVASRERDREEPEVRVLGRGESVRTWIEERSRVPKEYGAVRLGDVLRALITGPRNDLERRVLSEGTDSAGGFTVPDILLARWIDRLRAALTVVQAGAVTVPLTSDVTKIARLLTDPTAAWRAENAAVAESDPVFEAVTFTPRSLDVFFRTSRELVEDSVNAAEILEATLVRSFAVEVDRVCLAGTGTAPQPRGLRTLTGVNEVDAAAALASYDPILDLLAKLWAANVTDVSVAIMAPRTLASISKFKEAQTLAPLARPPALADWRFLMSSNVSITEAPGTASTVYMGDWSQMMLGFRTQMQVEIARELFRGNYQYGYFGHLRFDMQVAHPQSFGRLIGMLP
jgi:HK97 family phage major capsid protein/HK97 family phage prohead protease